ncbi:MAG: molybdopterin-dependent oxidoreductase [Spirochaetota bacterium]
MSDPRPRSETGVILAGLSVGLLIALAWVLLSPLLPAQKPVAKLPVAALPPQSNLSPGFVQLDATTNLHVTGKAPRIDVASWRLTIAGKVRKPLSLTFKDLRRFPRLSTKDPIICTGYFEDYARWSGASLAALLDRAGPDDDAKSLTLVAADGYEAVVTLAEARSGYALIAYELEGKAIPVLHGYPVRAAFPGLPGNRWVKWLVEIRLE